MSLFYYALRCVHSIILKKRTLVALLLLSYSCIVTINGLWLFLAVLWIGQLYVIVVFPDHTNFFFFTLFVHPLHPHFGFWGVQSRETNLETSSTFHLSVTAKLKICAIRILFI